MPINIPLTLWILSKEMETATRVQIFIIQSAEAVEYTDWNSADG